MTAPSGAARLAATVPGSSIATGANYARLLESIGSTPLVRLENLPVPNGNVLLAKLEGNNPAGSVKDRAAYRMILGAQGRDQIVKGDRLIEATSGNTGIALAMVAAAKGYRMTILMPEDLSIERARAMAAYGAEVILTPSIGGMEYSRDLAEKMVREGRGKSLDQFANSDNPGAHYLTTGPEIWHQTNGKITHFVSAMGTTGTVMGVSRYLKEKSASIQVVGVQPAEGARIAGIRRWTKDYLPAFYDAELVDAIELIDEGEAVEVTRLLAKDEGIFAGTSSGAAACIALRLAEKIENSVIVFIVCDRGDRYLSTGLYALP